MTKKDLPPNLRILGLIEALAEADKPQTSAQLYQAIKLPKPTY